MGETDTGGLNIIVYKWKKMKDQGGIWLSDQNIDPCLVTCYRRVAGSIARLFFRFDTRSGAWTKILTPALLLVTEGLLGQ